MSDWRAGWLGRLLRTHLPAAHAWGRCWCGADNVRAVRDGLAGGGIVTRGRIVGPTRVPTDVPVESDGTTYTVTIPLGLAAEMEKPRIPPGSWILEIDEPIPSGFRVEFRVEGEREA